MEFILTAIKKMLGIEADYTQFDDDITMNINTVLMGLTQMGVGPETGFSITGASEKWTDFLGDRKDLEAVKTYIYLKVRLLFDPPTSSFVLDSMKNQISELEWRLNINGDNTVVGGTTI